MSAVEPAGKMRQTLLKEPVTGMYEDISPLRRMSLAPRASLALTG